MPVLTAGAEEFRVQSVKGLVRALDAVVPGDTIRLRKGVYRLKESLVLKDRHDIVIIGDGACISGGVRIPKWRLRRASGMAKGVKCLNLRRYSVSGVCTKGDPRLTGPSWSEFYADGVPMRLSEWPDGAPLPLDSVVAPGKGRLRNKDNEGFGIIAFRQDRPLEWKDPTLGWLYGCFRFGWTCEQVPVAAMGPGKTFTAGDLTNYGFGFQSGDNFQRWKVLNIPEEVTLPGEYSLDTEAGKAFLLLPEGTGCLELSLMSAPLLKLSGCERVTVKGLEFSCSRGNGIAISNSRDVRIDACHIHGLGHLAATIDSASRRCGLSGCHLHDLGAGGVELAGGDRRNVVRGDNYVENCRIHNFNRIESQYKVGVVMSGLGNRISGCEFYDSASMAILLLGNDQTVEYCNIHHVCMDIEDNGAIYHGRNFSQRGSVIRYNYFHDIDVPFNVRATYHDDGSGAVEVYGNIYQRISSPPAQIGGGSYIHYHDNIFMDLPCPAIKVDGRLKTWGADRLPAHRDSVALADSPAFRAHYPEFAPYLEGDPAEPQHNILERTVFYNVSNAFEKVVWSVHTFNDDISGSANFFSEMHDNWKTDANPGFVDVEDPLKGFAADPPLLGIIPGFRLPQVDRIPATSAPERTFIHAAFDGKVEGLASEKHTAASVQ